MTNHERNTASAIDFQHLDQYTLGDEGLQAELLKLFSAQLEAQSAELGSCADAESWRHGSAHAQRVLRARWVHFHVADAGGEGLKRLSLASRLPARRACESLPRKAASSTRRWTALGG
jgi:hypothetical protein